MYRYDANTGDFPKLGDAVVTVKSTPSGDGLRGVLWGWGDPDYTNALVLLDAPLADGRRIVGWPVVCLKKISSAMSLSETVFNKEWIEAFETSVEASVKESDGFIPWPGGKPAPVSSEDVVSVKYRCGKILDREFGGYFFRYQWTHHQDESMKKWDIVAYKVVK